MDFIQIRHQILGRIWQAIAQSDVDLSSIPQEEQEKLVAKIADAVLVTVDDILDEAEVLSVPEEDEETDEYAETLIWKGRPFLSLVENYTLTNERIKIVQGLFGREIENFELIRIQDIDLSQGASERMLNIGDITIRGQDASKSIAVLRNVKNPEDVYETLRRAWQEARKRHGLQFREYM